jgi:hypothetical protein
MDKREIKDKNTRRRHGEAFKQKSSGAASSQVPRYRHWRRSMAGMPALRAVFATTTFRAHGLACLAA